MATTKITNPNLFDLSTVNTALRLPNGSTATRPTSASQGEWRFNTDLKYVEFYDGNNWFRIDTEPTCTTNTVDYPTTNTAYYKLDSSVVDQTTNNNDGTPTDITYCNGQEYSQGGIFNGSTSFFTSNVSVPTNWTVSIWIKRSPSGYFGGTTNSSVRSGVYFYSNSNGSLLVYNRNSSGGNIDTLITSTGLVAENTWTHVGITFDSTSGTGLTTCYINGVSAGTLNGTPTHSTAFTFGRSGDYTVEYFNGKIDQIRIFSSTLTSDQITELYTEVQCPCTTNTVDEPTTNDAYYKLDGNANDSTTNALNGTWGGTEGYEYGPYGIAASFNGSTSKITLPASTLIAPQNNFSVSVWFNTDTLSVFQTIYAFNSPSSYQSAVYIHSGGTNNIRVYSAGNNVYSADSIYTNNRWYHLVVTKSSTTGIQAYLNGDNIINQSGETSNNTQPAAGENNLGANKTGAESLHFDGTLDQVRIFPSVLSATQVTSLYDEVYCNTVSTLNIFNEGTSSCLALYEFEDDAKSTDSDTYDGTWSGTEAYGGGQYKKAGIFNGSSSYIDIPSAIYSSITGPFTLSAWVNTTISGSYQMIVAMGGVNGVAANGLSMWMDSSNKLYAQWGNGTTEDYWAVSATTSINTGDWFHVAITVDGLTNPDVKGYVNGVAEGSGTTGSDSITFDTSLTIGARDSGGTVAHYWNGSIDQVRIFNKELTATEILQVYTE
jgi:hypothetical protein